MDTLDTNTAGDSSSKLEKYKILYDLALKRWDDSYSVLPEQIREKGNRLLAIMVVSIAGLPGLILQIIGVVKQPYSDTCPSVILFSIGIVVLIAIGAIGFLIVSLYQMASLLKLDPFQAYKTTGIREQADNDTTDILFYYEILVNDLIRLTKNNHEAYDRFVKAYTKSFYYFIVAISCGVLGYIICIIVKG